MQELLTYHNRPEPSFSCPIKDILANRPDLALFNWRNKKEQTKSMEKGTNSHFVLLESEKFFDSYVIYENPYNDYRTKAAKEERDASQAQAAAEGKSWIDINELDNLLTQRAVMHKHPFFQNELQGLKGGVFEKEIIFPDEYRGKLDWWIPEKKIYIDYKTTSDIYGVIKQIRSMKYDYQANWYRHLLNRQGYEVGELYLLFQDVNNHIVRPVQIEISDRQVQECLDAVDYFNIIKDDPNQLQFQLPTLFKTESYDSERTTQQNEF